MYYMYYFKKIIFSVDADQKLGRGWGRDWREHVSLLLAEVHWRSTWNYSMTA